MRRLIRLVTSWAFVKSNKKAPEADLALKKKRLNLIHFKENIVDHTQPSINSWLHWLLNLRLPHQLIAESTAHSTFHYYHVFSVLPTLVKLVLKMTFSKNSVKSTFVLEKGKTWNYMNLKKFRENILSCNLVMKRWFHEIFTKNGQNKIKFRSKIISYHKISIREFLLCVDKCVNWFDDLFVEWQ